VTGAAMAALEVVVGSRVEWMFLGIDDCVFGAVLPLRTRRLALRRPLEGATEALEALVKAATTVGMTEARARDMGNVNKQWSQYCCYTTREQVQYITNKRTKEKDLKNLQKYVRSLM
jgi:hypothetical protein